MPPSCLVECALEELQEYQLARVSTSQTQRIPQILNSNSIKLLNGWIKLNWDAAKNK